MPTTYAYVEFPPPTVPGAPCPACQGAGITGDRYQLHTDGPVLLVEVVCPGCAGCGSADRDHLDCAGPHAWDDEPDTAPDGDPCPSCQGREWNPLQGFPGVDAGADADPVMLRVPCGCTTARARVWTVTAQQEGRWP
jgi:hypothetical protein